MRNPDIPPYLMSWRHPDSESTGQAWMQQQSSFRRAKIYNCDSVDLGTVQVPSNDWVRVRVVNLANKIGTVQATGY